ncbi:Endochitinase 33 [Pleurostoma richardsiae]|uniref:chitinase n=1 Tax=Pleurostoma richardsiae TaxID=41990 RepID=A0AA38VF64_9PEZI|nr:Endochitinase 33 [Pleurostoma richardsiae]
MFSQTRFINPPLIIHLVAALLAPAKYVSGRFSSSATTNLAVYWGQNSFNQATSQRRLADYCKDIEINVCHPLPVRYDSSHAFQIIPLAFLVTIRNPTVNFANAGDNCTVITGSTLLSCPQLEEDIMACQGTYGKTIMLSIGGSTYAEGGFPSDAAAIAAAESIWAAFGPVQPAGGYSRPFGTSVVDGFDLDFESPVQNMVPFVERLRVLMDAAMTSGGKAYYLSAAPQCPFPDIANNDLLTSNISFDFISVQFYNNFCGVASFDTVAGTPSAFNFDEWDRWAQTSANPRTKILLGILANTGAGRGYVPSSALGPILSYCRQFSSFGGVMMWDMSQLHENAPFLGDVATELRQESPSGQSSTAAGPAIPTRQLGFMRVCGTVYSRSATT